jgi:hypothetical protein
MLPPFQPDGSLPPGVHEATWEELVERFGTTDTRRRLLVGLQAALRALAHAGCRRFFLDGSFVTTQPEPGDWDGCWDAEGVNQRRLDPLLSGWPERRANQKQRFGGDIFPAFWDADGLGNTFFQSGRDGTPRGIILIDPRDVP